MLGLGIPDQWRNGVRLLGADTRLIEPDRPRDPGSPVGKGRGRSTSAFRSWAAGRPPAFEVVAGQCHATFRNVGTVSPDGDILLAYASRPGRALDTHHRTLFADWTGLCVTLSADTLTRAAEQGELLEAVLHTHAALPADTPTDIYPATRRAQVIAGFVGAVLLVAFGVLTYALLAFRTKPASARQVLLAADAGLAAGVGLAALLGAGWHRSGRSPFLTMRPDTLACRDLERPISWLTMDGIHVLAAGVHTFLYLVPGTPLPKRVRGWRVRINARRRCVAILSMRPRGMTVQAYWDLLECYRVAAYARDALAVQNEAPP